MKSNILISVILVLITAGFDIQAQETYFDNQEKKGFYNYEILIKEVPEKKKQAESKENNQMSFPPKLQLSTRELMTMHPDIFTALLDNYHKKAMTTLSVEDAGDVYQMQKIAIARARGYSNVMSILTQKEVAGYDQVMPTTKPGIYASAKLKKSVEYNYITGKIDNYALIYFYQDSCQSCMAQSMINEELVKDIDIRIKNIDVGDLRHRKLVSMLNITSTPTMYLIKKGEPGEMQIASGVVSVPNLINRLYKTIRLLEGDSSPQNFNLNAKDEGTVLDYTKYEKDE
ncbi:MAG: conjugal transfer protein TraF [Deltaproteobacteria bacterium]|jgi:conjugal transfer pilus assembly protein TraF|nr:conjugal transfer protein TraF [Deltaproteobacteria bacterium]MBT4525315.1 conjugal transfer protein TraF [Deltaproteobacteria bacterium]